MLDRSKRNKFLIILLFFSASCSEKLAMNSTTAVCPDGKVLLMKEMSVFDVKNSIIEAIKEKHEYNYNLNYTVISNGESSIMLNNIKPEELGRCDLQPSNYYRSYKKFIRSFKR